MLEPLFRCNLACAGCGKIDYPDEILNKDYLLTSVLTLWKSGSPMVSIAGGEPLIHKDMSAIVNELIERKKFIYLCTNALCWIKRWTNIINSYLTFSVHLDGDKNDMTRPYAEMGFLTNA